MSYAVDVETAIGWLCKTANKQVIGSHGMGNGVPLALHDQPGLPKHLLD